jgi:hypothetical protein
MKDVRSSKEWLPTAAVLVQSQFRSCGICGGQSYTWAGFLRVLQFPLSILISPAATHPLNILSSGTIYL